MSTRSWTSRKRKRQIPENKENKESKDEDGKKEEIPEKTEQTSKKTKMSKKDTEREESDEEHSDPSNEGEVPVCPHLRTGIKFESVKKKILNPSQWFCKDCNTTEQVWACLSCGYIGCGRYLEAHASIHAEKTKVTLHFNWTLTIFKHPIVLEINSKLCHCYKCNNWVSNDTKGEHIQKLRTLLEDAQNHEDKPDFRPKEKEFKKLDKLNTFLTRWRLFHLSKAFNKWKDVVQQSKASKQKSEPSKDKMDIEQPKQLTKGPSIVVTIPATRLSLSGTPLVKGQSGLRNLGNTCFMNSVLQVLREYFMNTLLPVNAESGESPPSVKIGKNTFTRQATIECLRSIRQRGLPKLDQISVAMQLHQLLRVLWSGKWAVVTPFAVLEAVWKFVPKFRNYQQQDAQEFWCYLRDRLHQELTGTESIKASMDTTSIITLIFEGKLSSEVTCCKCKSVSKTIESFMDLSLDIPVVSLARGGRRSKKPLPTCTLSDCLTSYTAVEKLEGKIRMCDTCKTQEDAEKRTLIETLPDVLCIVLKRFCWTGTARAKVNTRVTFPLDNLDVSPFSNEKEDTIYDLESVIMHHGTSLLSGHYTAYCYNETNDAWVHCNDSVVTIVTEEEVAAAEAYMLFYKRRTKVEESGHVGHLHVSATSPFKPVDNNSIFLNSEKK